MLDSHLRGAVELYNGFLTTIAKTIILAAKCLTSKGKSVILPISEGCKAIRNRVAEYTAEMAGRYCVFDLRNEPLYLIIWFQKQLRYFSCSIHLKWV